MNSNKSPWYSIANADELDTPALVVFPERVKKNIASAIELIGDIKRLRPHVKTNKSANAIQLMIDAGIDKYKCATIAEAELLGSLGAKDVLLAYQPTGPKLNRFINLIRKFPSATYSCLADNLASANEMSQAFNSNDLQVPVYIDLNVGMNRTGIEPGEDAIQLYSFLSLAPGIAAAGIHAYDGHIRDKDIAIRTKLCDEAFQNVVEMKSKLNTMGFKVPTTIVGGSPTFPIHAKRKDVECSPGTFIYWDYGYATNCPEQPFIPAAVLVSRIISLPSAGKICTDLGHKSVAAENEMSKRVFFLNAEDLVATAQSEEHLILDTDPNHHFKVGDILYGIPWHICPTVALYERMYTIENGRVSGVWMNSARDRVITI